MLQYTEFRRVISEAYTALNSAIENKRGTEEDHINAFANVVKICVPSVDNLMTDKDWIEFWERYEQRANDILQNSTIQNNCLYFIDYALVFMDNRLPEEDRLHAYKLFSAFDNTIRALTNIINSDDALINKFQKKLNAKIKAVITDGPKKADNSNNSSFKNFVNEIAFFYHIAIHTEIELVDIEVSLPNGKSADFQLRLDGKDYLVEIMTIHNTARQDDINRFVEGKINDKFSVKTNNLEEDPILNQFRVQTIMEYNDNRLLNYVPILPEIKCLPPMMSFLQEKEGENHIILVQLPLREDIKKQLTENNESN